LRVETYRGELRALVGVLAFFLASSASAGSAADSLDAGWRFSVTPYLWVPRIDGTLNFTARPGTGNEFLVTIEPIDYIEHLNVPIMVAAAARKGPWTLATDFFFVDFSGDRATVTSVTGPGGNVEVPIDAGSSVGLQATIWSLGGGYAVVRGPTATLQILGGFRYFAVETSLDWQFAAGSATAPQSGTLTQSDDLWDAIVGIQGEARFGGGRWLLPYYLDAGTGSSSLTLKAMAGLGYAFGWWDLRLMYHHLQYDAGESALIQELSLSGPALGASFRF